MVTLLYFARLREALNLNEERLSLPTQVQTVAQLLDWLKQRGPNWQEALGSNKLIRIAVNQEMANPETRINEDDEIAIFPPVTGG